jgi:hypothetical protein
MGYRGVGHVRIRAAGGYLSGLKVLARKRQLDAPPLPSGRSRADGDRNCVQAVFTFVGNLEKFLVRLSRGRDFRATAGCGLVGQFASSPLSSWGQDGCIKVVIHPNG